MRRARLAPIALGLFAGGCGGAPADEFAGLNKDEAMLVATDWIGREARSPSSPLYSRHPTLVRIYHGRNSTGAPAWVAVYEAKSIPDRTCVWVWSEGGPLSERTISEIDLCEPPTETEKPA